jgi:hypothetical protein
MRKPRFAGIPSLLLGMLLILGAASPPAQAISLPQHPYQSSYNAGIFYALELKQHLYQAQEPVEIEFLIASNSNRDCTFSSLSHPAVPCFVIFQGKKMIWSWPSAAERKRIPPREWLGAGLTKSYRIAWKQEDGAGRPVPAGRYTLLATFPPQEDTGRKGDTELKVAFTIVAKTSSQQQNQPGLQADIFTDKTGYPQGEPVRIQLLLLNKGKTPLTFSSSNSQRFDFVIRAGDKEVWRWSNGRMFALMIGSWKLAPGESVAYSAVWEQKDKAGNPVPPGRYKIEGLQIGGGQASGEITIK